MSPSHFRTYEKALKKERGLILGIFFSTLFLCWLRIAFQPDRFSVSLLVSPVAAKGYQANLREVSLLSLIPSVAGQGTNQDFKRYLKLLKSEEVAALIWKDQKLLIDLFPDRWDQDSNSWRSPGGARGWASRWLNALLLRPPPSAKPSIGHVYGKLQGVRIEDMEAAGLSRLTLNDGNPERALRVLKAIHEKTDHILKDVRKLRVTHQISQTLEKIRTTNDLEHRTLLIQMLAELEKDRMLTEGPLPYAAEVIIAPEIPVQPSRWSITFFLMFSFALSIFLSALVFVIKVEFQRLRAPYAG